MLNPFPTAMPVQAEDKSTFYAACVTSFLLRIEWGVATGFLPVHVHELGGSPIDVALVFSVFAAIMVITSLIWGAISDSVGKRKLFIVAGMMGLLPIYLLIAFQEDVSTIILLRGSTAILKGAVVPCVWALTSDMSSREFVGRNMGILSAAELAGFAVGPGFGGLVADYFGFSFLWFLVAAICFAGGLIFMLAGKDSPKLSHGSGTFPLLRTVRSKSTIRAILVVSISFAFVLLGFSFLGPNLNVYLISGLGYSKTLVGTFSFVGMGVAALIQPLLGHISDRYGRKPIMILSGLSLTIGNLALLLGEEIYLVVLSEILINFYSSFNTVASAYISDVVEPTESSGALGILNSMGSFARSAASVAGGLVISVADIPTALKIAAGFPVVMIAIVLLVMKESGRPCCAKR